jgi:putative tryptophan/tyrosine transport system substrate-binding protein
MRRRQFIAGFGAAWWPLAARAQQSAMPVVGFLSLDPRIPDAPYVAEFRQGLAEAGFIEGRTVAIEYRRANNQVGRLVPLAAELVQRQVAVIVAIDSGPAIIAAKAATSKIPIVFEVGTDPIKFGLVASLSRPGGNMTGVSILSTELASKRLDLLLGMAPSAMTVAYLTNPDVVNSEESTRDVIAAARALGRDGLILEARNALDIDAAFATLVERRGGALIVAPYLSLLRNGKKIADLAAQYGIPTMYPYTPFVRTGGLISYNANLSAVNRQIGSFYVAQILRGAKPADLPVQQPTKFELAINLKTAKTLGLTIPPTLLALADEAIE